jgi:hypothetical protein
MEAMSVRFHLGKEGLKSGKEVTPGQSCSLGVPRMLFSLAGHIDLRGSTCTCRKILKISSISESPGNSGLRVHISAKMQPTDHMSTPVEYCRPPSRISGERYHSVTTWDTSVNVWPKHASFTVPRGYMCAEGHQRHGPDQNLRA